MRSPYIDIWFLILSFFSSAYIHIYIYIFGVGSFGGERETNSNEYKLVKCRVLDDASLPVKMWYDR